MSIRILIAIPVALTAALTAAPLHAGPRTSTNYSVATDTVDAAGRRTASASYTNDASAGGIAGISTVAAPAETVKAGYIGQLYDVTGLTLTAPALTVNETATLQLGALIALDDATFLAVPAADAAWGVHSGPLTISASGLATAGVVYQDTSALVRVGLPVVLPGFISYRMLTVVNTIPDNFGTYAADNIADDWQVQYFGLSNALAGPTFDPDGDGFDNLFEYRARLVPTDPLSFLSMSITSTAGGGHAVTFSPRFIGTTYTLLGSSDLSLWEPVTGAIADAGAVRTINDPEGAGLRRFYSISVERE